jgi:hypothetical protein
MFVMLVVHQEPYLVVQVQHLPYVLILVNHQQEVLQKGPGLGRQPHQRYSSLLEKLQVV